MKSPKYHLYLTEKEHHLLIQALIDLKNKLLNDGSIHVAGLHLSVRIGLRPINAGLRICSKGTAHANGNKANDQAERQNKRKKLLFHEYSPPKL